MDEKKTTETETKSPFGNPTAKTTETTTETATPKAPAQESTKTVETEKHANDAKDPLSNG